MYIMVMNISTTANEKIGSQGLHVATSVVGK